MNISFARQITLRKIYCDKFCQFMNWKDDFPRWFKIYGLLLYSGSHANSVSPPTIPTILDRLPTWLKSGFEKPTTLPSPFENIWENPETYNKPGDIQQKPTFSWFIPYRLLQIKDVEKYEIWRRILCKNWRPCHPTPWYRKMLAYYAGIICQHLRKEVSVL